MTAAHNEPTGRPSRRPFGVQADHTEGKGTMTISGLTPEIQARIDEARDACREAAAMTNRQLAMAGG